MSKKREQGQSAGSRALILVLRNWSEEHVAKSNGVLVDRVKQWCRGQCKPTTGQRVTLSRQFGIPVALWEQS